MRWAYSVLFQNIRYCLNIVWRGVLDFLISSLADAAVYGFSFHLRNRLFFFLVWTEANYKDWIFSLSRWKKKDRKWRNFHIKYINKCSSLSLRGAELLNLVDIFFWSLMRIKQGDIHWNIVIPPRLYNRKWTFFQRQIPFRSFVRARLHANHKLFADDNEDLDDDVLFMASHKLIVKIEIIFSLSLSTLSPR